MIKIIFALLCVALTASAIVFLISKKDIADIPQVQEDQELVASSTLQVEHIEKSTLVSAEPQNVNLTATTTSVEQNKVTETSLDDQEKILPKPTSTPIIESKTTLPKVSGEEQKITELIKKEVAFANNLSSCTKTKITFEHMLTGDILEKEILGISAKKCVYIEEMPGGGKMTCKYTESERKIAANYYVALYSAETISSNSHVEFGEVESESVTESATKIDGIEVSNPLQEFITNGVCVVSGYE